MDKLSDTHDTGYVMSDVVYPMDVTEENLDNRLRPQHSKGARASVAVRKSKKNTEVVAEIALDEEAKDLYLMEEEKEEAYELPA